MFSNVNEVIEQIRRARRDGYRFVIDWAASAYRHPFLVGDPWEYYFDPCFEVSQYDRSGRKRRISGLPSLPGGTAVACSRENIITPRLLDGVCAPLLLPRDRTGAHRLIDEHLHLKKEVQRKIDGFENAHFDGYMIGVHIRGPGRTDGGVPEMRRAFGALGEVPVEPFFGAVDCILSEHPTARIFACSDSAAVMRSIVVRYGNRVMSWPALRSEFGEMHTSHPKNKGQIFSPYRLGLDVIVDAYLLSKTSVLVHGNSNVANFVLCLNPSIEHVYIQA